MRHRFGVFAIGTVVVVGACLLSVSAEEHEATGTAERQGGAGTPAGATVAAPALPEPKPTVTIWSANDESHADLLKALGQPLDLSDLDAETTLGEGIDQIASRLDIPIFLAYDDLKELEVRTDTPIGLPTGEHAKLTGQQVLTRLVNQIDDDMAWTIDHEAIVITTGISDFVRRARVVKIYDVVDLAATCLRPDGAYHFELDVLAETIMTLIEPVSWEVAGGPARITAVEFSGIRSFVIATTPTNHERIAALLAQLRQMQHRNIPLARCVTSDNQDGAPSLRPAEVEAADADDQSAGPSPDADVANRADPAARRSAPPSPLSAKPKAVLGEDSLDAVLRRRLQRRIRDEHFDDEETLAGFAKAMTKLLGFSVLIDGSLTEELGLAPESPVPTHFRGEMSAAAVIYHVLRETDPELGWMFHNGVITITTRETTEATEHLVTHLYDVVNLGATCQFANGVLAIDYEPLIDVILVTLERDAWEQAGGSSRLDSLVTGHLRVLVVQAKPGMQPQVERLLTGLRSMRHPSLVYPLCAE